MVEDSNNPPDGTFESGTAERKAHYPDEGYNLVEIDYMSPPGDALMLCSHSLSLSGISMPSATEFEDYVVYDQHGRAYTHDDLQNLPTETDAESIENIRDTVQSGEGKEQRLGLYTLSHLADTHPDRCLDLIPVLTTHVAESEPGLRAEALTALAHIAEAYPEQVTPAADDVLSFLEPETDPTQLAATIRYVSAIADHDPGAVVDAVPKLAAVLQEGSPADASAITPLQRLATTYPDAVVPITQQLLTAIEDGDNKLRIGAIAVLGNVAKEYPHVAEETIPVAIELLDADHYMLRGNAAGLLAELAREYPAEVRPVVPRAIELLDDDKEKVRYNATSILASLADAYPAAVEPAVEPLIGALDDDFSWTRSNACWALGYLAAAPALDRLETLADQDPEQPVREGAAFAVERIKRS